MAKRKSGGNTTARKVEAMKSETETEGTEHLPRGTAEHPEVLNAWGRGPGSQRLSAAELNKLARQIAKEAVPDKRKHQDAWNVQGQTLPEIRDVFNHWVGELKSRYGKRQEGWALECFGRSPAKGHLLSAIVLWCLMGPEDEVVELLKKAFRAFNHLKSMDYRVDVSKMRRQDFGPAAIRKAAIENGDSDQRQGRLDLADMSREESKAAAELSGKASVDSPKKTGKTSASRSGSGSRANKVDVRMTKNRKRG